MSAKVTDAAGLTATSIALHATVDNTPPTTWIAAPAAGSLSDGPLDLQAHASDAYGIASVQFTVDGNPVGDPQTAPLSGQTYLYGTTFDTSTLTSGLHAIAAIVTDAAGNTTTTTPVSIHAGTPEYLPVLNYHEIAPPDGYSIYDQTPAEADAQLAYLKANGYQSVTLAQYQAWLGGADIGVAKPVLITVDDGTNDEMAWDALLQKYGFKGVLFVVTGFADGKTPGSTPTDYLSWASIQSLATNGRWEIAFHAGLYGHGDSYDSAPGSARTDLHRRLPVLLQLPLADHEDDDHDREPQTRQDARPSSRRRWPPSRRRSRTRSPPASPSSARRCRP